jgi:hypothetical protein
MMIGLKRDLRVESTQMIYPEEVSEMSGGEPLFIGGAVYPKRAF